MLQLTVNHSILVLLVVDNLELISQKKYDKKNRISKVHYKGL
jgi:hypothetical protein